MVNNDLGLSRDDVDSLAAAVDVVLTLLDRAERRVNGADPSGEDESNESTKQDWIKRERRRYKEIRARLLTEEHHGVPVATEFLEIAFGMELTALPDDGGDDLYEQWLKDR